MNYLLTFSCYGHDLHGDESGSTDRRQNRYRSPTVAPSSNLRSLRQHQMNHALYELGSARRQYVLAAIQERCGNFGWTLWAAHVRTNHVHLVDTDICPARAMADLKAFASRRLNSLENSAIPTKRWTRHGSTRWLWNRGDIEAAIRYTVYGQGDPMAVFEAKRSTL